MSQPYQIKVSNEFIREERVGNRHRARRKSEIVSEAEKLIGGVESREVREEAGNGRARAKNSAIKIFTKRVQSEEKGECARKATIRELASKLAG